MLFGFCLCDCLSFVYFDSLWFRLLGFCTLLDVCFVSCWLFCGVFDLLVCFVGFWFCCFGLIWVVLLSRFDCGCFVVCCFWIVVDCLVCLLFCLGFGVCWLFCYFDLVVVGWLRDLFVCFEVAIVLLGVACCGNLWFWFNWFVCVFFRGLIVMFVLLFVCLVLVGCVCLICWFGLDYCGLRVWFFAVCCYSFDCCLCCLTGCW